MPESQSEESRSVSEFARSIETVFRKLIRFLVGRVSLANLQEMVRHVYVEEAESKLKSVHADKNVPLTKLALITGIDTRTLKQIRKNIFKNRDKYTQLPLKELTPESAVVEAWAEKVELSDDPEVYRTLSYDGPNSDFEQLFRSTIPSRGITQQSLINRLVATNSVRLDKTSKTATLVVNRFSPYFADDEPNALVSAMSAISNLVSTLEANVGAPKRERLFQRQAWTFRLPKGRRDEFREAMRSFLEDVDRQARSEIATWEQPKYEVDQLTAGVGYYYFEEPNDVRFQ